jgi:pre-60S factor REI1
MGSELDQGGFLTAPILEQTPNKNLNTNNIVNPSSSPNIDYYYEFDESRCLFCNQESPDQDQNLVHMLKAHGLYVDLANLRARVDVESLLAYFHLVISGRYECLYCGTQRNTRQAVEQHMMAKGHCKYDITDDEDAELRDFYQLSSSSDAREGLLHRNLNAMCSSYDAGVPPRARRRNEPRPSKRSSHRHGRDITDSPLDQAPPTPTPQTHTRTNADSSWNDAAETPSPPLGELRLSTRALKQECTLNNQLARLRADDRRSLLHLPASQQRALLAAHHKQMEDARRTEQTKRTNLESAGNKFNCLGKIRLIRKPPHTGNVHSLNR